MTAYGICHLSLVPVRKEPSHASEMVTQLLFGEYFTILEQKENWRKIRTAFDHYEGWLHEKQFQLLTKKQFTSLKKEQHYLCADMQAAVSSADKKHIFPILIGSVLPEFQKGKFSLGDTSYKLHGKTIRPGISPNRKKIVETALQFLHAPYLWGGRSEFGIDCSGFTQIVFKVNGLAIPRDAYQQAEQGTDLQFVEEAKPGDLAFFDNEKGKITHVGIIVEAGKIVHASGCVRLDKLDLKGIYAEDHRTYTHQLRVIKRLPFNL